jgi:uncharacterized protein (DUF305 family)
MAAEQKRTMNPSDPKSEGFTSSNVRIGTLLIIVSVMALLILIVTLAGRSNQPAFPVEGSPEVGFARDMALHHSQAVNMTQLLYDRTENPALRSIALDIMLTQQDQIGQMGGWLDIWGLPKVGITLPMIWMDMGTDGLMPGMATDTQIEALRASSGVDADRLFIQLMIVHHQGGIHMAEAILERTDNLAVETLAQSILRSQQIEIDEMTLLLAQIDGDVDAVPAEPTATP